MRIMVVGAGAVGGFIAARLALAGHEVSIIARGAHLEAIRAHGLRIRRPEGAEITASVAASDDPAASGPQDLVLTTLKAPALPAMLPRIMAALPAETPVMTAMNGVFWWYGFGHAFPGGLTPDCGRLDPSGALGSAVHPDRALGVVIQSTNEVIEPGVVMNRSAENRFAVGAATSAGKVRLLALLASLSDPPAISFEPSDDIRRVMWRKLLRNLTTAPLSVLTSAEAHGVINDPDASGVSRALFFEGAAVAAAHGFDGLAEEADQVFAPGAGARQKPSMRQDLERGRPMEIDTILRIVQDFARQSGVPTPVLDIVLPLVMLRARVAGCYRADT
ncbi:MAG: 2-dehydropantoate 2-reductase [Pseudomonadota bacterium]